MEGNLNALTTIFTEFYYWMTIVLMFLIHAGFCTYEVGVSRRRNHLKTLMKNAMAIPIVTVTFYLFGWWIYFAFPNGPGITGGLIAAPYSEPWNPLMGAHLSGVNANETGVTPADALIWHRLNHLGRDHRARQLRRILDHSRTDRLGSMDPRCGLGLASARLDGEALGLS